MYCDALRDIAVMLGVLAGRIPDEEYEYVRTARSNMMSLADQLEEAEKSGVVPAPAEVAAHG